MKRCALPRLALLALAIASSTRPAAAAEAATSGQPLWELGIGLGALQLPQYRGSDQRYGLLLPVPYLVYRGRIFKADREGTRAVLLDTGRVEADVSVSASAPTRSRDNTARAGMADLLPMVEIGPNLNTTLARGAGWKLDLRLPVRAAFTVERHPALAGWNAAPHLNVDVANVAGWKLGMLAGPVFGDRRLHATFYDVPAAQATADRPAYRASGGFGGWTAVTALSRRDGNRWVGVFAKADSLAGARFADSPLARQRQQWTAGIAVAWVFAQSERRVEVAP